MSGVPSPAAELERASSRLHSALPLATALAEAMEELRAALRAQAVALARTTPDPESLRYVAAAGPGAAGLIGAQVSSTIGLMSRTIAAPDITLTFDVRRDHERLPLLDQLAQARARSLMSAPVTACGQVLGILQVLNPIGRGAFGPTDRPRLAAFAALVASALVQRGDHRRAGLGPEAWRDLELRRRCSAWSLLSESFLRELCELGNAGHPMILRGEPGSGRERTSRALAIWLDAGARESGAAFVRVEAPDLAAASAGWSGGGAGGAASTRPALQALPALGRLAPAGGTVHLLNLGAVPASQSTSLADLLAALGKPGCAGGTIRITAALDASASAAPSSNAPDMPAELRRFFGDRELTVPALAARAQDLPAIAGELVRGLKAPLGSRALGFEPRALEQLATESWPRNLQSLRQRVAALLLATGADWIPAAEVTEQMMGTAPAADGASLGRRIERALGAADPSARAAALRRLELSGRPVPAAVLPAFLALLEDPNDWLRIHAARILAAQPERRALSPLVARLEREDDPAVRRELVTALGRLEAPVVAGSLLPHLSDQDPDVRAAALLALGRIGGEAARSAAATMAQDPDPRVRATALGAGFLIETTAGPAPPVTAAEPGPVDAADPGPVAAAPTSIVARLLVLPPGGRGEPEPRLLTGDALTIGRTPQNDLSLPDPAVSKRHASLICRGDEWVVRDDASTNGTRVNGIRVAERTLESGDEIGIGTYVLRFETESAWSMDTAPAAIANDLESTLFRTAVAAPIPGTARPAVKPDRPRAGEAVARLNEETRSEDREERRWAARVLGDLGQGVARLIELAAGDPDPEVRLEATRALGRTRAPEAVAPLRAKLADRWARIAAIEALGALRDPAAVDPLLDLVRSERSSRVRRAVVRALGQIGDERASGMLAELASTPALGVDAVAALAQIGGPAATTRLVSCLDAGNPLCPDAVRGLARLRSPAAIPRLVVLLAEDEFLAQRAEEALVAIGPPAVPALIAALALPDERPGAIRALAAIGDPAAAEALVPLAKESAAARVALRQLGRRALPALYAALERDPVPASRLLASMRESESGAIATLLIERLSAKSSAGDSAADLAARWIDPALVALGPLAVERLRGLVRESPPPLRRRALRILGQIGEGGAAVAIPELIAAVAAPDEVAIEALRALTPVADPEVGAAIRRRWPELGAAARTAAVAPLAAAGVNGGGEAAAAALAPALADPDPGVRSASVLAAARLPEPFAATICQRALRQDPSDRVRAIAAALREPESRSSIEALRAEFAGGSPSAQDLAARARALTLTVRSPVLNFALDVGPMLFTGRPTGAGGEQEPANQDAAGSANQDAAREFWRGLARHGTAILLLLAERPDGEKLASDPALAALWPALEFRPELATRATALLGVRGGAVGRRLREHLVSHEEELWLELLLGLDAIPDGDHAGLLLDALLELRERDDFQKRDDVREQVR